MIVLFSFFCYLLINFIFYSFIFKRLIKLFKSLLLKFVLINFLFFYLSTTFLFIFSIIFSFFTDKLLLKSLLIYFLIIILFLFFQFKKFFIFFSQLFVNFKKKFLIYLPLAIYFLIIFFLLYWFFSRHLILKDNKIYTSYIYWDFHWHVQQIQNFTFGDNFPPQNESLAGIFNLYHFLWALIPSSFQILGLDLASSINFYSAYFLSLIIIASFGFLEEFILNKKGPILLYFILPLFLLSHGSFKLVNWLLKKNESITLFFHQPYFLDFNTDGSFGYNGNMFNIFYFLEERQLIFACFSLIIYVAILLKINKLSKRNIILFGLIFSGFLFWHLFVWIIFLVVSLVFLFLSFLKSNQKINFNDLFKLKNKWLSNLFNFCFILFLSAILIYLPLKIYVDKHPLIDNQAIKQFPAINFNFPTMIAANYFFSLKNALLYYLYAYGFRLLIYLSALVYFFKQKKSIFIFLISFLTVFILINTVQLSPTSIYDNHKWLKPFNLIMDIFSLGFLFDFFYKKIKKTNWRFCLIFAIFLITSASGIIVLVSYFIQSPNVLYADLKSKNLSLIKKTSPKSVFLTDNPRLVFLGGRKNYISADDIIGNFNSIFNFKYRIKNKVEIESLDNDEEICHYLIKNKLINLIDVVFLEKKNIFLETKQCLYQ